MCSEHETVIGRVGEAEKKKKKNQDFRILWVLQIFTNHLKHKTAIVKITTKPVWSWETPFNDGFSGALRNPQWSKASNLPVSVFQQQSADS